MGKKKIIYFAALGFGVLAIILGIFFVSDRENKSKDNFFENKEFEAVFCSMDYLPLFTEEDFLTYRGLHVLKYPERLASFRNIGDTLTFVFEHNPKVNTIYLELNPAVLWEETVANKENWADWLEKHLLKTIRQKKHTTFEILLPYPEMSYWLELDKKQRDEYLQVYGDFVTALVDNENVLLFYMGAEPWLIQNADNYTDAFQLNGGVEKHIYLSTFCDRRFLVDSNAMTEKLRNLAEQIEEAENTDTEYPKYEDWCFAFIGDSIIGYDMGTTSVSGVVGALTGATTYNCGKNGAAAAKYEEAEFTFLDMVEALTTGNTEKITEEKLLNNVEAFIEESYEAENLCIFINFGLNDYFNGLPVENQQDPEDPETYAGALRIGVKKLKAAWPEAEMVIMAPTYTSYFNEGTDIMSDKGEIIEAYRESAKAVAQEMDVHFKNNYEDMGVDLSNAGEYLVDGCHFNEWGRFVLGKQIISFLDKEVVR